MSAIKEFKDFAMRGNVVDMAVGIIIGTAIGKIVTSLVNDIIMPPIGLLLGGIDFTAFAVTLKAAGDTPAVAIHYGTLINVIIDFLIVVLVLFIVIKLINRLKPKKEPAAPQPEKPSKEELLLTEIRDLLKKG